MSRLDSRDYRWFVLCVPPQKELAVERIMGAEGFATFVPVAKEHKFANAAARGRMDKKLVSLPLMPRYVFLGMSDNTPGWARVFCYTSIFNRHKQRIATGVIGMNGRPYEVPHDTVRGKDGKPDRVGIRTFMLRHNAGEFNAPSYHKYMQTHREFEPGDMVITEDELFTGKVIEIDGHTALLDLEIFGGRHKTRIALEKLVPVR